ncbi:MAG: hypothetical protein J6V70_01910 [Kiritimatiellae bacterium]|nr:hypothetical protein [Kiritimatiellia bacterium]
MFEGLLKSAIGGLGLVGAFIFVLWVYFINFTPAGKRFFFNKYLLLMRQGATTLVGYIMGLSRYIGYKTGSILGIILVLIINTILTKGLKFKPLVPFYPEGAAGESFLIMLLASTFGVILLWGQYSLLACFLSFRIKLKSEAVEALECITFPLSKFSSVWAKIAVSCAVIIVALCGLFLLNGTPENLATMPINILMAFLVSIIDILLIIKNLIVVLIILSFVAIFTKRLDYIAITNELISVLSFSVFPVKLRLLMFDFSPIIALWICGIVHSILLGILIH